MIHAWFIFDGLPTGHYFKESWKIVDQTEKAFPTHRIENKT